MDKTNSTNTEASEHQPQPEPREAALQQVEKATAEQQERTHRLVEREAREGKKPQA